MRNILKLFKPPRHSKDWNWDLLNKREIRDLISLIRTFSYITKGTILNLVNIKNRPTKASDIKQLKIHKLYDKLKVNEGERAFHWQCFRKQQLSLHFSYNVSHPKEKKDNKQTYASSFGGGMNSIRYPSKKRSKQTWKRFYKLFPHAKKVK